MSEVLGRHTERAVGSPRSFRRLQLLRAQAEPATGPQDRNRQSRFASDAPDAGNQMSDLRQRDDGGAPGTLQALRWMRQTSTVPDNRTTRSDLNESAPVGRLCAVAIGLGLPRREGLGPVFRNSRISCSSRTRMPTRGLTSRQRRPVASD